MSGPTEEEVKIALAEKALADGLEDESSQHTNDTEDHLRSPCNDELSGAESDEGEESDYKELPDLEEAKKINDDQPTGNLDSFSRGAIRQDKFPEHILYMIEGKDPGRLMGEIECLGADQIKALKHIFLEVRNHFHIELTYQKGKVYGQAVNIDSDYCMPEMSDTAPKPGTSTSEHSAPPHVQIKKRQDPIENDCDPTPPVCAPKVLEPKEASKCVKTSTKDSARKSKKEGRYTQIEKCYPWVIEQTRKNHPKTVMDFIRQYDLDPSDDQLNKASKMKTPEMKAIRLTLLMKTTNYFNTAPEKVRKDYRKEIEAMKK